MRILMIAVNDPAGSAIQFTKAINRYTEHTCRLLTKEIRYNFLFEKDLHLPWLENSRWDEVEELLATSDIFHFHMTADEYIQLGPFQPVDFIKGKGIVHHHHGHPDFRANPQKYRRKYRQRRRCHLLVSTPDLLKLLPGAGWQPNLVPINAPLYLPVEDDRKDCLKICQAPTRTDLKNTAEFLQVVQELRKCYPTLQAVCIEQTKHTDCLRTKQSSQIHFDHMQGYFGVSSLESLSQGKPVIAGIDDWNKEHIMAFSGCSNLPWIFAGNLHELKKAIEALVAHEDLRRERGAESRRFMEECWNESHVIEPLIAFYHAM